MDVVASDRSRAIVRAAIIAVIVGTTLVMVNHGDHILDEPVCPYFGLKAALTYLTPFLVSLVSSTLAARDLDTEHRARRP